MNKYPPKPFQRDERGAYEERDEREAYGHEEPYQPNLTGFSSWQRDHGAAEVRRDVPYYPRDFPDRTPAKTTEQVGSPILSVPEPRSPGEPILRFFLRVLVRATGKNLAHTFAYFFDTQPLKGRRRRGPPPRDPTS